jgi:hypothetical protein
MAFSIYHAFTKKDKGLGAKLAMLFWAIAICAGTGVYSGYVMIRYPSPSGWLIICSVWNIIYGCLLLIFLRYEWIDIRSISDRDALLGEVILGLGAALIILVVCLYIFKLHWVISYSICLAYITGLSKGVSKVLGG